MRAVVYDRFQGSVQVRDLPDPRPEPDGVVVEVRATGLCRSDWHGWMGHDADISPPQVPGHEVAGVVAEVGHGIRRVKVGDRVTVPFVCGCGGCDWCRAGDAQVCPQQRQPGFTDPGSFAEFVALPAADTNLVVLPDAVDDLAAASLGCRFATAYRGLTARAKVQPGEWVCIVGAGGVGLSSVQIAVALGARVVVIDPNPAALTAASALGAEHALTSHDAVADEVQALIGGAQVSVDAVGGEQACATGIRALRRRGRHVQIGLVPPVAGHPRVPMARVLAWELDVLGSHGMAARDYPAMLRLVEAGRLRPDLLLERVVGLAEAASLLPGLGTAAPAGITVVDPRR